MLHWSLAAALAALALAGIGQGEARADVHSLTLHNLHTEEDTTIVFKRDGVYDADGLKALDTFLRDPIDNKSTYDMDPHLFDLVWDVYQQTGSGATIQVLDGYRSPATNAWLRKNSDGVAENSLHMKGQAIDFYIPGVPLAKLRAIGLQMQAGGVGFYPDSGSPFVHLDTGSVRHWPLMTRKQLLAVFPDGKTLDIPTDGDPLPGYKQAQAAYAARQAQQTPVTQVASFTDDGRASPSKPGLFGRIVKAVTKGDGAPVQTASAKAQPAAAAAKQPAPVVVASTSTNDGISSPKPNLAPRPADNSLVAALTPAPRPAPAPARPSSRAADFAAPELWTAPAVPAALALAMAGKEIHQPGSSLPIAPTAVVATVSVRPGDLVAAGLITRAVIRSDSAAPASGSAQSAVLAYAADAAPVGNTPRLPAGGAAAGPVSSTATVPTAISFAPASSPLLMTALDTQGLRMWMNGSSTRARPYALLTMPDGVPTATMLSSVATGTPSFGKLAPALRTDRFTIDAR